eukprot:EG_transcript_3019
MALSLNANSIHSLSLADSLLESPNSNPSLSHPAPILLGRSMLSSTTPGKLLRGTPASPLGAKRERVARRRPFRTGVEAIDVEVGIITRSIDRVLSKAATCALSSAPFTPPTFPATPNSGDLPFPPAAADPDPDIEAAGGPDPTERSDIVRRDCSSPVTPAVSSCPSSTLRGSRRRPGSSSPPAHSDSPLEFEADLMLRALERLVNRVLDVQVREDEAQGRAAELEHEVAALQQENAALREAVVALQEGSKGRPRPLVLAPEAPPDAGADVMMLSPRHHRLSLSSYMEAHSFRSCWNEVLRCFRLGQGDYRLRVLVDSKLAVIHAAQQHGLLHVADNLLREPRPTITVKEFRPPHIDDLRPPPDSDLFSLGIALDLEILKFDSEAFKLQSLSFDPPPPPSPVTSLPQLRPNRTRSPERRDSLSEAPRSPAVRFPPSPRRLASRSGRRSAPPAERGRSTLARHAIVHYVGTAFGTAPWENPVKSQRVLLRYSSMGTHADPSDLSKRDMAYFITADQPGAWVEIDFLCGVVLPTAYSFASAHPMYSGYYPRGWELRASLDQKAWVTLRTHEMDESLTHATPFGFWELPRIDDPRSARYFRYFRLTQTAPNSFGTHEFQISSFEVYGRFLHVMDDQSPPPPPPAIVGPRPTPSEADELPLMPKAAKKKAAAAKRR